MKQIFPRHTAFLMGTLALTGLASVGVAQGVMPVPGYTPPVQQTTTPIYADDTRGIYVESHSQHRLNTPNELHNWNRLADAYNNPMAHPAAQQSQMGYLADGTPSVANELERIAAGQYSNAVPPPPLPAVPQPQLMAQAIGQIVGQGNAQAYPPGYGQQYGYGVPTRPAPMAQPVPDMGDRPPMPTGPANVDTMNMLMGGQSYAQSVPMAPNMQGVVNMHGAAPAAAGRPGVTQDGGQEILVGRAPQARTVDMHNSIVQLREDRISVRRALQRMMDQIGATAWTTVWDLSEQNAALPDMEISIYAEEPFMSVLNALLARIQTRSGQPLRVIRYDGTQRLVLTDRSGSYRLTGQAAATIDTEAGMSPAVTERVLKDAMVSLHYDEIPLVDALESVVNQAGKGQWRLRMYAGMDQVLKPAHIEEPFSIAVERLLKLFDLKYEIFPGGKLIVVTHNNRFGFQGATAQ